MAKNQLILIADDFGLSDGINRGILELLSMGRLSGTSSMVNMPAFRRGARDLAFYRDRADLGLHLTLTLGSPTQPMPVLAPNGEFPRLGDLMRIAFLNRFDHFELAREIKSQIDLFKSEMGFLPHYIDGHQHAHILPGIRQALFQALAAYPNYRPWIRNPLDLPHRILMRRVTIAKSLFIAILSLGLKTQVQNLGLETHTSFSGVRAFTPDENFKSLFQNYMQVPTRKHLVMCHPGYVAPDEILPDPVSKTRPAELDFLKSDEFGKILSQSTLRLTRFSDV